MKNKRKTITLVIVFAILIMLITIALVLWKNGIIGKTKEGSNNITSVERYLPEMKVGDIVSFDPTEGVDPSLLKMTSVKGSAKEGENVSGNGDSDQTLDATLPGNKLTSWYILEKDGQNITLISSRQTETKIKFKGGIGYLYAEQELHKLCSIYGHHKLANKELNGQYTYQIGNPEIEGELQTKKIADLGLNTGARSLTERDIEKILGNPNIEEKRELYRSSGVRADHLATYQKRDWPTKKVEIPTLKGIDINGKCAEDKKKSNLINSYYEVKKEDFPELWKGKIFIEGGHQWVADRSVYVDEGHAFFRTRYLDSNDILTMAPPKYSGSFQDVSTKCSLRVVCNLTLDYSAEITKENGAWIIIAK